MGGIPQLYQGSKYKPMPIVPIPQPAPPDLIGDALRADAVAYWTMNESSGTRADSTEHGNDLPENGGSISNTTGKVSKAAAIPQGSGVSIFLGEINPVDLQFGDTDFYFCGWFRFRGTWIATGTITVISKGNVDNEFVVYAYQASGWEFDSGDGFVVINDTALTNTWYFIEFYNNSTANEIGLAINHSAFATGTNTIGAPGGGSMFRIGESGALQNPGWMDVDGLLFLHRLPTQDERDYLYNSGAGRALFPAP